MCVCVCVCVCVSLNLQPFFFHSFISNIKSHIEIWSLIIYIYNYFHGVEMGNKCNKIRYNDESTSDNKYKTLLYKL